MVELHKAVHSKGGRGLGIKNDTHASGSRRVINRCASVVRDGRFITRDFVKGSADAHLKEMQKKMLKLKATQQELDGKIRDAEGALQAKLQAKKTVLQKKIVRELKKLEAKKDALPSLQVKETLDFKKKVRADPLCAPPHATPFAPVHCGGACGAMRCHDMSSSRSRTRERLAFAHAGPHVP